MTVPDAPHQKVTATARRKVLEAIVTSREEAIEAELGGANRLELVRSLEEGGLTPEVGVLRAVIEAVSIPVRVMVRERNAMSVASAEELGRLQKAARDFAALPIDGLVLGFVTDFAIDIDSTRQVLAAAPHCRGTFHRAFESVRSPLAALQTLKQFRQIDRVLVRLGSGAGGPRISDLLQWQKWAAPEMVIVTGLGLHRENVARIREHEELGEIHVGRLLREPEETWGRLDRRKVSALGSALA